MKNVYVCGIGETLLGKFPDRSSRELIQEAGTKAIQDAGIGIDEIEAVYVGNFAGGQLMNQGHLGALVAEELGIYGVPSMRVEAACASGGLAYLQGVHAIQAGLYETVLVGGVERMTHQTTPTVTKALASAMDVDLEAASGLSFPGAFGLIAQRYFYEHRNVKEEMAMASVNSHANASLNPHAQMRKEVSIEQVLEAPLVADPIGLYDCSLITDGAAFLVLSSKPIRGSQCVKVAGIGHGGDALTLGAKKSITSFAATKRAAGKAYEQAKLAPKDIDLAEVHDCFSITQIINMEDLGFAEVGKGGDAIRSGDISRGGRIPINTSGGLKAKGHPIGATGICQVVEVVTQLRGDADERQVSNASVGLTHNIGGTAATCVVSILRGV
ncbi:acetyl-CoA acetyltransferase [Corynebacterium sp. HMSC068H04]|uniref:thiolase domain-containing protein n=1 Tax=Corynebacterium sp. HMSC068H04 TaxID=1739296 RepID=UPI0008A0FF49|nr:thiolase domain-containing protein [Corynebacterium sp. HMSC068H04]OFK92563.1 acetyl-CoA acetyltransferase [Corynebacterium sp. HMSC068H04]